MRSEALWMPPPEALDRASLARFARTLGFDPHRYDELHAWSVADKGAFWSAVWDLAHLPGSRDGPAFVPDPDAWMTGARFFPEARVSFAEAMLRGPGEEIAVHLCDEAGGHATVTRQALREMVGRTADGLRAVGVAPGDRVAAILPNRIEALVSLLASAAVGAVWTSCSPDFGTTAIVERLGQVAPKVLFAAPAYSYGGQRHDIGDRLAEVAAALPGLGHLVLCGDGDRVAAPAAIRVARFESFGAAAAPDFLRVPFAHPLYILYTSGTTGAPKAIVHGTGGVLLQHFKEHLLHGDVRPGDRLAWYTNTAWMMYHWLVSALGCGAAVVLYDGAPALRGPAGLDCAQLWAAAERCGLTHLGISPKYLSVLADRDYRPGVRHDLSSLRWLLSAGAPVAPHQFDWAYAAVKRDMILASISGGTEILGCFLLGSPIHPVRRGELTVKGLGMAVSVLDERGAPVLGRPGELVCTEPFPSMPLTFWGPDGDARYRRTYFAARPEIWTHGDLAELTPHGAGIIHGRSDDTLKPGGVRIGTAEIYAACEGLAEIEDCLAFGLPHGGDEEIVLCVRLREGLALDEGLVARIRAAIREAASPRHVPHRVHAVADIPQTLNGKHVAGAARAVMSGQVPRNLSALANPECLAEYAGLAREPVA